MTTDTEITTRDDLDMVASIFERISSDLSMIIDREIEVGDFSAERATARASGEGQVHISFKLALEHRGAMRHGCLLVPLPDAVTLAAFLMMVPEDTVAHERARTDLDRPMKEALLEVGNFVAGACDAVLRGMFEGASARSEGCQGVRADVRPALKYQEGDELVVGRASARIGSFEPFELILQLPPPAA